MADPLGDWVVLSLAPAPPERVHRWFAGLDGLDLRFPTERKLFDVRPGGRDVLHIELSDGGNRAFR